MDSMPTFAGFAFETSLFTCDFKAGSHIFAREHSAIDVLLHVYFSKAYWMN
jgi:hypothetical protein